MPCSTQNNPDAAPPIKLAIIYTMKRSLEGGLFEWDSLVVF